MRLLLLGGDGDQSYLSARSELEVVERDWFQPETPRGRAKLVIVVSGPRVGKYFALSSKVVASIDDQLAEGNHASVVVSVVSNPGLGFRPKVNLDAIGMAVVKLIE